MNFIAIGRINAQIKNMGMEFKWNQKKKTGDITPKSPEQRYMEEWRERQEERDTTLENIYSKLQSGKSLTLQELQYLEEKDPQSYQKAKAIEMEKESYEKALKRCKTKEDVERLKMSHVSSILSNVKSIMNNPAISDSKKLELVMQEHSRMEAIKESTQKFVESGRYQGLPTEAEKNKAEQDMAEAEEAEREEAMDTEKMEGTAGERLEQLEQIVSDEKKEEQQLLQKEENSKLSRVEAEQTPEARKVKLAEAKKNYQRQDMESYAALMNWESVRNWRA